MRRELSRLLQPKSIAVIGGGAWCRSVLSQLNKVGFSGPIWHVHPKDGNFGSVEDLPAPPDAAFIGINRDATVEAVAKLSSIGAGGAVCFASGFSEVTDGADRNADLLSAAGTMPILGPNCYGFINALDGVLLWPDQHGIVPVSSGVAILTQSSNIAINLTMQRRGLPISYVITCGNQAQTSQAQIAMALLEDPRVTAIGLHVEGFGNLADWQDLTRKAQTANVPLVAVKIGRSELAQTAAISHTASLAGTNAGARALLAHLGIAQVDDLSSLLEALKLLHLVGPLESNRVASISCSGGEASLVADMALDRGLVFPELSETQRTRLADALGPKVTLANPLDYHTYIWRDEVAMTKAFSAMIEPDLALTMLIVDFPRADLCDESDWDCSVRAAVETRRLTGGNVAMVATLPELMPEHRAQQLLAGGVVPLNGLAEAMNAISACSMAKSDPEPFLPPGPDRSSRFIPEPDAKAELSAFGLTCPAATNGSRSTIIAWSSERTGPFVVKSVGEAHKSETGGVILGVPDAAAVEDAAAKIASDAYLVEEMVCDGVAELLIGVQRDPAHGFVLTLGAGGTLTEIMNDTVSLLVPASRDRLKQALLKLKVAKQLAGFRGMPAAELGAVLNAAEAIQLYVLANADRLEEVEVNPLICTPVAAIAVDALIRRTP